MANMEELRQLRLLRYRLHRIYEDIDNALQNLNSARGETESDEYELDDIIRALTKVREEVESESNRVHAKYMSRREEILPR